ncbi:hypothetical protein BGP_3602 [Beggiatoa sp. PS]|nr:hypothetical protein BGP_3602 [Beggiatoa sp. PS]
MSLNLSGLSYDSDNKGQRMHSTFAKPKLKGLFYDSNNRHPTHAQNDFFSKYVSSLSNKANPSSTLPCVARDKKRVYISNSINAPVVNSSNN